MTKEEEKEEAKYLLLLDCDLGGGEGREGHYILLEARHLLLNKEERGSGDLLLLS